uniref:Sialin-like n=1 Tax=Saccoglossus kowalevskii TaxID=10224 RepID=A0ABM0MQF9_SACKO|nr:PREDICTED: sialin-like [Saccoglossus kowalevskii]
MVKTTTNEQSVNDTRMQCNIDSNTHDNTVEILKQKGDEFDWSSYQQGLVLSAYLYGHICSQFIYLSLTRITGPYYINFISLLISGLLSMLTPASAGLGFGACFAVQFMLGVLQFTNLVIYSMWESWSPAEERSKLLSFATSGCASLLLSFMWLWLVFESPDDHPRISETERRYIKQSNAITCMKQNGMLSSLTAFCVWAFMMFFGWLSQVIVRRRNMSVINTRRMFTLLSMILPAALLIIVAYTGCNEALTVSLVAISAGFSGTSSAAFKVNVFEIAPSYGGVIYSVISFISCLSGLLAPALIGALNNNKNLLLRWQIVCWIASIVNIIGAVVFLVTLRVDVQKWAMVDNNQQSTEYKPL